MKLSALLWNEVLGKILFRFFRFKPAIDKEQSSEIIREILLSDKPAFTGRFGSTEIRAMILHKLPKPIQIFIRKKVLREMIYNSGFFPASYEKLKRFSEVCTADIEDLDILGSWRIEEIFYYRALKNVKRIEVKGLEPFLQKNPWSEALKGKKVLVVHPFAETIKKQYETKRHLLFKDTRVLPEFASLTTVKAVQTMGDNSVVFSDWFAALDYMKDEISKCDFDIAILGCGAYGMPLCAHIKRMGKKAIYMGGSLQLLFGIKGKRWENLPEFKEIINEHFVRPAENEKPENWEKSKSLIDSNSVGGYW
jgi:hypothetical protein